MLRKMFATTAIAALMTAPVMAQDTAEKDMSKEMDASSTPAAEETSGSTNSDINKEDMLASTFIGKTVYTSTNDDAEAIGDVEDVVLDKTGKVDAVVVSVGGFLGIGDKSVALPFDRLSIEMKDNERWIVSDATSEELNQMPEFDDDMFEPESDAAMTNEGEAENADADNAAAETEEAADDAADTVENAGEETEEAAESAAAETEEAAEETEQAADAGTLEVEQEGQEMAAADTETTETEGSEEQPMAESEEQPAEGEQMAEGEEQPAEGEQMAEGQDAAAPVVPADGQPAAGEQMATEQPSLRESMQPADMESVSVEELIGTTVYGQDEENLGEIGDVILGEDKAIEAYIIDVGGFLGIGEKPVAISPDAIELMKQAESDDYAIFTKFTEEQLDEQAEYSEEEYESNPDSVVLK
ncbi:PRC-barrel domain-containing protein [Notoacmeibacter sp. MSK16QG-6]|uniref:PRC-barrel domain-containing protein n=1 Tax=Notoacmeibacter sp. MSK16QG-6 TaxID=2957982 RepID=UPI0020A1B569|nr:PRC-barrel domain-containing protein [Notoacmeibacter sp. MSK16QG-6]MCP1199746.1 PRC-barrel domain-containing protein [Notoacmeibacter sp. MSK16QG-6]